MDKDPLAREREFRRKLERAALDRRDARIRRARPWLVWLRPFGALFFRLPWLALALAVLVPVGLLFALFFGLHIKWTDAYACSLAEARRSPFVVAELGEPIEAGLFAWSGGYIREGAVTDTSFSTTLSGPKGEGTLKVRWYSSPVGSSLQMELEKGGRTHPVYGGPVPCR